jgi:hypothetical protein
MAWSMADDAEAAAHDGVAPFVVEVDVALPVSASPIDVVLVFASPTAQALAAAPPANVAPPALFPAHALGVARIAGAAA